MGEKRAKQFFQKHTNSAIKKVGKKIVAKKCEKTFFIFPRISWQKMGEKMRETIFPETHQWFEQKCWEKNRRLNVQKTFFYIHMNIVTKKNGEKTGAIIFPETNE